MFKLFFCWKITNNFNRSVTQWELWACFPRIISVILGTVVERNTLMSSLGINRDRCFVLWWSRWRTLAHTDKYFEKVWERQMRGSTGLEILRPIPTKIGNVTGARYEFGIKHCTTLKINKFILIRHFKKTSPRPDKIYTFRYMFQNYFQIFWKGFTLRCMSMENTRDGKGAQCPFIHQSCKARLHWA